MLTPMWGFVCLLLRLDVKEMKSHANFTGSSKTFLTLKSAFYKFSLIKVVVDTKRNVWDYTLKGQNHAGWKVYTNSAVYIPSPLIRVAYKTRF